MLLIGFIIAQIIIFGVVLFMLKNLIFQDTNSAINRLTKLDDMNRAKEKQLVEKIEEAERVLKEKTDKLESEEKRMKLEAERAANQLHDDIVSKAKSEGEEIIKKAVAAREKYRSEAAIEAETKVIDFCQEMLSGILTNALHEQMHGQLIQDFIGQLETVDMNIVTPSVRKADVIVAKKLDDAIVAKITEVLTKRLGRALDVKVTEDPKIIGGIVMKFGTLVIDDSLAERLKESAVKLKDELSWKH